MKVLQVRLEGVDSPVGFLSGDDSGAMRFDYAPDYLAHPAAHPISFSLPLREAPFGDAAARAFFQNLLPENDQLRVVMEREGLDVGDVVGLLEHLGADVSGAISCLPPDSPPVKVPGILARDYDPIDQAALTDIVDRLGRGLPLPDELRDPSPVSGFQRKIALVQAGDDFFALPRPGTGAPTTHILKVPDDSLPREARHEARAAQLAVAAGLEVAFTESRWIGDYEVVITKRFDRATSLDGQITRLHQEDFAQALGLPPRLKYERNGREGRRFDAAAIALLLRRTAEPAAEIDAFLRTLFFNLMIGNTDNHAKNHALIYDVGPIPRLAPLYDLVPIRLSARHHHLFSFRIGEAKQAEELASGDLVALFRSFGLSEAATRRFLAGRVAPMLTTLVSRPPSASEWDARFDALIEAECERLAALMLPLTEGG